MLLLNPKLFHSTQQGRCYYQHDYFTCLLKKLFIYLGCVGSQLRHTGSSLRHANLVVAGTWDLVPNQALDPGPLPWERRVLPTGPPGTSLAAIFFEL